MKTRGRMATLCPMIFSLIIPISSHAQTKPQTDDARMSQSIIDEIRLLRKAFQNAQLYSYRGQILIERIRVQQNREVRLTTTIENLHDEITSIELQNPQVEERIKELNERVDGESDSRHKAELENEVKALNQILLLGRHKEEQLRKREAQLRVTLAEEQAKLDDLEKRLELLETALERDIGVHKAGNEIDDQKQR